MLNCEIRDAAARIEPVGLRKRVGGAGGLTGGAGAAAIRMGRIGVEGSCGEDFAEEQPGTMVAGD